MKNFILIYTDASADMLGKITNNESNLQAGQSKSSNHIWQMCHVKWYL